MEYKTWAVTGPSILAAKQRPRCIAQTLAERCIAMSCVMTATFRECAVGVYRTPRASVPVSKLPNASPWCRSLAQDAFSCEAPDAPLRRNCNGEAQSRGVTRACGEIFGVSADRVPRSKLQQNGSLKIPWRVQLPRLSGWGDSLLSEKRLRLKRCSEV